MLRHISKTVAFLTRITQIRIVSHLKWQKLIKQPKTNAKKDTGKKKLSFTVGRTVNWYDH